jgi:hypothetical protein
MMKTANTKPLTRDVFTPTESFTADVDGTPASFVPNKTFVREGHPILDQFPLLFKPVRVQYDVEQATAAPGEVRA